jgi:hypothetical protein
MVIESTGVPPIESNDIITVAGACICELVFVDPEEEFDPLDNEELEEVIWLGDENETPKIKRINTVMMVPN